MAYVRAGRAVRNGRLSFVPGASACAAMARRFPLSLAPLSFIAQADSEGEMETSVSVLSPLRRALSTLPAPELQPMG